MHLPHQRLELVGGVARVAARHEAARAHTRYSGVTRVRAAEPRARQVRQQQGSLAAAKAGERTAGRLGRLRALQQLLLRCTRQTRRHARTPPTSASVHRVSGAKN